MKKSVIRYRNGLADYELGSGSFSEDSQGRCYFNATVKVEKQINVATKSVGIDLGLKECAVASDSKHLIGCNYHKLEAKIKHRRKDELHKFSAMLTQEYGAIFVGHVSSKYLIHTKMTKSTLDAGWSLLQTMLEYKSGCAGVIFKEVNEAYTTQTCPCCSSISPSSPKGRAGLRIREWTCSDCGSVNDRDLNAARNTRALGQERLAKGAPRF